MKKFFILLIAIFLFILTPNCIIFAEEKENTYTVILDGNGGCFNSYDSDLGSVIETTVTKNEPWCQLSKYSNIPVRKGYVFKGYSLEKNGSIFIPYNSNLTSSKKINSDVILYAVWEEKNTTVTWNANGGYILTDSSERFNKYIVKQYPNEEYEMDFTVHTKKKGEYFAGWSTSKKEKDIVKDFGTVKGTTTFYAIWKKGITISIKSNGGRFIGEYDRFPEKIYVKSEFSYTEKPGHITLYDLREYLRDTNRRGKELSGFSLTPNGKPINNPQYYVLNKNVTLYCLYNKKEEYQLKLHPNGGNYPVQYVKVEKGQEFYGERNYTPTAPKGKIFIGWSKDKKGKTGTFKKYKPQKDETLYAQWKKAITITFNANGGKIRYQDSDEDKIYVQAGKEIVNELEYAYQGDDFYTESDAALVGWSKTKDGSQMVNLYTFVPQKDITLYAVWSTKKSFRFFNIEFDKLDYHYTGKPISPKVTVYDNDGNVVDANNYSVTYYNNFAPGYGTVVVEGKNGYTGSQSRGFSIIYNEKAQLKKLSRVAGKKVKVQWKKAKGARDYKVYVIDRITGDKKTYVTKKTAVLTKGLKKGHTYYIYIRPRVKNQEGDMEKGIISNIREIKI